MASDPNLGKSGFPSEPDGPERSTTPIKRDGRTLYQFSDKTWGTNELYLRLAAEMSPHFVGPMPVVDFLTEFLPLSTSEPVPSFTPHMFANVVSQTNEKNMYDPFVGP